MTSPSLLGVARWEMRYVRKAARTYIDYVLCTSNYSYGHSLAT